jgi:hypothetical protein
MHTKPQPYLPPCPYLSARGNSHGPICLSTWRPLLHKTRGNPLGRKTPRRETPQAGKPPGGNPPARKPSGHEKPSSRKHSGQETLRDETLKAGNPQGRKPSRQETLSTFELSFLPDHTPRTAFC